MIPHSKQYMLVIHSWGYTQETKYQNSRKYHNIERIECDTIEEINEYISLAKDMHKNALRPDNEIDEKVKDKDGYGSKSLIISKKRYDRKEINLTFDDNHYWWGYAVFDFVNCKIIDEGGVGLDGFAHPMKSLKLLDIYFRGDDEIPANYKWSFGEYEGWLRFRWGDGENAIEKVKARKEREAAAAAKREELKNVENKSINHTEFSQEFDVNSNCDEDYSDIQDEFENEALNELAKRRMDKYGW